MSFVKLEDVKEIEPFPGYHGRVIHCESMTLAYWRVDAEAVAPEHTHVHEQICHVIAGTFELTVGEETQIMEAGSTALIPPNVPHCGRAHTDCRLVDIFHPVRDDLRGAADD